jgi:hypothetical protein
MIWMFDDSVFPQKPTLNEMAVYMLVARFSLTGQRKGWFGKWKEAEKNLMVKNIGRTSYYEALNSLETMGVIQKQDNVYSIVRVADNSVRVADNSVRVADTTVRVADDIEYNYKNKGIEGDARTHTCDAPASAPEEDLFIVTAAAFALQPEAKPLKSRDETIAQQVYKDYTPEEKQALLQAVRNGYNKKHNFRFTVEDFRDENPFAEQRMTYSEYYSAKGTTEPVDGWRQVIPGQGEMYYVKP